MNNDIEKEIREEFECTYKTKDHEIGWYYYQAGRLKTIEVNERNRLEALEMLGYMEKYSIIFGPETRRIKSFLESLKTTK